MEVCWQPSNSSPKSNTCESLISVGTNVWWRYIPERVHQVKTLASSSCWGGGEQNVSIVRGRERAHKRSIQPVRERKKEER